MRLLERLRIQREAREAYLAAKAQDKSHEECCEIMSDTMQEKYGESIEWPKIIEIIMLLLALFRK